MIRWFVANYKDCIILEYIASQSAWILSPN